MSCQVVVWKKKRMLGDRVYMFFIVLYHNLDQVSSHVLTTSSLPIMEKV
jgi:hypothetical protein